MRALVLLARRHLVSGGLRAALTATGVAFGVALVVAIQVINASTLRSFTDAIDDLAGTAALQVRGPGSFPETIADQVRRVPGVDHAVPIITTTFFTVDPPEAGEALSVFAADVTDGHAVRTLHLVKSGDHVVDDPLSFLVDPASVIITDAFAARTGLHKESPLRLRTPVGVRTFTVRGILPPGGVGRAFGGNLLLMDVLGAQTILGRDGLIDQVDVTLKPGARAPDVQQRVDALLRGGLEAVPPARRGEQIEHYLHSYQTLLSGVSGLALLAAVFLIGSAVATSVASRRREIGLLRCTGARRRDVVRLFLAEATLIGAAGTVAGVPLGLGLARLLIDTVTQSTELVFSLKVFRAGLDVPAGSLALGAASGLGAAVVAGWLPARDAVQVSPVAAARSAAPPPIARQWPGPGTVLVAAACTVAGLWAEIRFDSPWSGNLAAIAADVACAALLMRYAGRLAATLLVPLRRWLGFAGQLAVDRLVRIPAPLALAAGVLGLGLGLMIMAGTLARSFEESVLDFIRHQVRADLVVASTATTGWIEAPIDESIGDRLRAVAGVGRVERLRLAEHHFRGARISIDSLDATAFAPGRETDFSFAAGDPAAALAAVRTGDAVLVSRNFARQAAVDVGQTLALDTPNGRFAPRIVGVVVDYVSPRGSIVLTRDAYQRWWTDRGVTRFHVTLAPGADAAAVRQAIATGIGRDEDLKILTQRELYTYHQDAVRRAFRITRALEVLPLVVAGLGLAEALLAASLDRRRELALLRTAGATRRQIGSAVVGEAIGVGALGLAGGVLIGLVLSLIWVRVNFTHQLGWEIDFHFATDTLFAAAAAALAVSVPAGLVPARWIARLPILVALRHE